MGLSTLLRCISRRGVATQAQHSFKTMQAWQAFEYGSPDVLQLSLSQKIPVVTRPDDVLVEVYAASVNPLDVMMLKGYGAKIIGAMRCASNVTLRPQEFPLTVGRDFSGTVVATGSYVKNVKCGDEVFGVVGPQQPGSHADFVKTSSLCLCKKPSNLNHVDASSIPYVALTAWSAISTFGQLTKNTAYGKRVLVLGASGGVGTFAVQLLKAWGSDVTAVCSTDSIEMVQNLGADCVIDYLKPDFMEEFKSIPRFDLILDTVGVRNQLSGLDRLKTWKNSKYVTIVSPLLQNADQYGFVFGNFKSFIEASCDTVMGLKSGQSVRWAYFIPNGCALKTVCEMVESKQIVPVIDEVFSFNDIPEAYRKVLDGHARGKTVIDFCSETEEDIESKKNSEQNNTEQVANKL